MSTNSFSTFRSESMTSKWYKPSKLDNLFSVAILGDLIEFGRGLYSHWGIYAGERMFNDESIPCVFHCGSDPSLFSGNVCCCFLSFRKRLHGVGAVAMEPVKDVCGRSSARINNRRDKKWTPLSADEILEQAEFKIQEQDEYNLITNNCEHFAKWCRYGVKESYQVKRNCIGCWACLGVTVPIAAAAVILATKTSTPVDKNEQRLQFDSNVQVAYA